MTAWSHPQPFPRADPAGPSPDAARARIGSHARFGRTAHNGPIYGEPGTAYVYLVSGMHHCLNVVTALNGRPAAFLIRALEPLSGHNTMRAGRAAGSPSLSAPAGLRDGAPA